MDHVQNSMLTLFYSVVYPPPPPITNMNGVIKGLSCIHLLAQTELQDFLYSLMVHTSRKHQLYLLDMPITVCFIKIWIEIVVLRSTFDIHHGYNAFLGHFSTSNQGAARHLLPHSQWKMQSTFLPVSGSCPFSKKLFAFPLLPTHESKDWCFLLYLVTEVSH